jgi:hypothetical protein
MRRGATQGEALAVWALLAADVLAILVVYSVVDPSDVYNVSRSGLEGGLSRALVQLDFPSVAGAAIPLALLAIDALPQRAWYVGAPAIALCAVMAWPGVVDSGDLDARAVNAIPALGVVLAFSLTVTAARKGGAAFAPARSHDGLRVAVAVVAVLVSLPWIAAEIGLHLPRGVFLTDQLYTEPGKLPAAAVHLGHHHGTMGMLMVLSALLLSRPRLTGARLRHVYAVLVSLMLSYGVANMANDFWHEQVVKRGWTSWDIPSAEHPRLHVIWLLMLAGTTLLYALGFAGRDETAADRR